MQKNHGDTEDTKRHKKNSVNLCALRVSVVSRYKKKEPQIVRFFYKVSSVFYSALFLFSFFSLAAFV
jgi:hypothetical protein